MEKSDLDKAIKSLETRLNKKITHLEKEILGIKKDVKEIIKNLPLKLPLDSNKNTMLWDDYEKILDEHIKKTSLKK